MLKKSRNLVALGVLVGACLATPGRAAAEMRLGILPRLSAVDLTRMFTPLAEYLSRETGEKVTLVVPKDFTAFKEIVAKGGVEMGFANPVIYVQLRKDVALDPVALAAEMKAGTRFRGVIIARRDSGIEKIQDLKGRKLIFVEQDSAGGHIFQMLLLSKAGIDVNKDFTKLPFAKKHDNVTMAVFNKAADAGGIREDDLDKMKDKVDVSQLRIVGYSDYFPNWPLFVAQHVNRDLAGRVKAALLKLKPGAPETTRVLEAAQLAGFAPVSDKDYDQLREAAKLAGAY
jgi:phosphonate transport system substrate-binding protein